MSRLTLAAFAAAASLCAAPALAQEGAAPVEAPAAAPAKSPEEVAFEAKGAAFQASAERMGTELEAVMADESLDSATRKARAEAVVNTYEPQFAAFADELATFLRALAEKPENAAQKDEILAAAEAAPAQIRGVPAQIRAGLDQALAAPAPSN